MGKKTKKPQIRFAGFTDDWEQRKLLEFGQATGGTSIESEFSEDGIYKVISIGSYSEDSVYRDQGIRAVRSDKTVNRILNKGDITMILNDKTASGNIIGRVLLIEESGGYVYNQRTERIEVDSSNYDSQFIYTMLNAPEIRDKIIKQSQGNTQIYVNWTTVSQTDYLVPQLSEQRRIGEYFSNLDNLITLHQRKLDKLKSVKKSMLEKMIPQNGEVKPEIRFTGFTDDWEQRKLSEVAERYDNLRIPVSANLRIPGSTPYYGANGIQDYVEGYTHEGEFILVAEDGANDLKNYPVKCVKGRIWVNNHAHVLQGKNEIADNRFLAFAISQADIESLLVGGGRAKLNAETLMGLDLLLPVKQEQVLIGNYFANLDHLITLHQRKLEKLQNIKKAMLEKMFV